MSTHMYFYSMLALLILLGCTQDFWKALEDDTNARLPGTVEAVYLQCYAGGVSNSPCHIPLFKSMFLTDWKSNHTVPIYPGLWGGT